MEGEIIMKQKVSGNFFLSTQTAERECVTGHDAQNNLIMFLRESRPIYRQGHESNQEDNSSDCAEIIKKGRMGTDE